MKNKDVRTTASNLHKDILKIVKKIFPDEAIKQEVVIKIDNKSLFLDILLPRKKIAFECDGQQHEKFNKFFHKDINDFMAQKKNDSLKKLWCIENAIILIRIKHSDPLTEEFLNSKIMEGLTADAE